MKIKEHKEPMVYLYYIQDKWYSEHTRVILEGIFPTVNHAAMYGEEFCNWTFRQLWDSVTIVDNS